MTFPNARDCEHGRQRGKCPECDAAEEISELTAALEAADSEARVQQARIAELEDALTPNKAISIAAEYIADLVAKTRKAALLEAAIIAETPVAGEQDDITMEAKDRIANELRRMAEGRMRTP